jgi:hypothetical protein
LPRLVRRVATPDFLFPLGFLSVTVCFRTVMEFSVAAEATGRDPFEAPGSEGGRFEPFSLNHQAGEWIRVSSAEIALANLNQ